MTSAVEASARVTAPSSRGLGHHPLKVATRVRIPLGLQRTSGPSARRSGWARKISQDPARISCRIPARGYRSPPSAALPLRRASSAHPGPGLRPQPRDPGRGDGPDQPDRSRTGSRGPGRRGVIARQPRFSSTRPNGSADRGGRSGAPDRRADRRPASGTAATSSSTPWPAPMRMRPPNGSRGCARRSCRSMANRRVPASPARTTPTRSIRSSPEPTPTSTTAVAAGLFEQQGKYEHDSPRRAPADDAGPTPCRRPRAGDARRGAEPLRRPLATVPGLRIPRRSCSMNSSPRPPTAGS